jgi:hypothetical protein
LQTRYRIERLDSETLGRPVSLDDAIRIITTRIQRLPDGETLRVRKILYELPPEAPPGSPPAVYTSSILSSYRTTVLRHPRIGWAGGFVCKLTADGGTSQHAVKTRRLPSAGNAIDWTAPDDVEAEGSAATIRWLWELFDWIVRETKAGRRKTSELIFRDVKWTPERGRRPYLGPFHFSHVHESASPYVEAHAACIDD